MSEATPNGVFHPAADQPLRQAAELTAEELRLTGRAFSAEEILFTGIARGLMYALAGGLEYAGGLLLCAGVTHEQFTRRLEATRAFIEQHPIAMEFARAEDATLFDPCRTDRLPPSPGGRLSRHGRARP